ncbi:hypothetical protein [Streptomyces sp. SID12501]|uniref:BPL/LPL catalytic domain-containing protein n=1 Tax=Streptomyces sp. SID12501 TaxID=2706042 RepID=A0A6B3BWC3_9ACTN|nr:hypothetical protein [Streptomyces sp. SID12501]NEC88677.1 hypothetical protein [Streptomyces sp. SID12501]
MQQNRVFLVSRMRERCDRQGDSTEAVATGLQSIGFALNVDPDLDLCTTFTACALPGVRMTSLAQLAAELGLPTPTEEQVRDAAADAVSAELAPTRAPSWAGAGACAVADAQFRGHLWSRQVTGSR